MSLPFRWAHTLFPRGKLQDCTQDRSHIRQGSVLMKGKFKVPGDSGRKGCSCHLHAQFGFFQKVGTHGILRGLWAVFLMDFPPKSYTQTHTDTGQATHPPASSPLQIFRDVKSTTNFFGFSHLKKSVSSCGNLLFQAYTEYSTEL